MPYKYNPFINNFDDSTTGPTGTVSAAGNGTAALPGIAFASDTSTGIYRPGASQLGISTGGTLRIFVNASGNVGIGDAGPDSTLTIKAAASTTPLRISGPSSEFARVDSSGRLLVGTSASSGAARLEVAETRRLSSTSGASSGWIELTDSASVTTGTLTTFATISFDNDDPVYFRTEVMAANTGETGYSSAVSIREGLLSGYGGTPYVLNSTEVRNLSGSVNAGVIGTAVTTGVAGGNTGGIVTFSFRATATLSGALAGSQGLRLSYKVSALTTKLSYNATLSSNI
jgi:hypothetical protein